MINKTANLLVKTEASVTTSPCLVEVPADCFFLTLRLAQGELSLALALPSRGDLVLVPPYGEFELFDNAGHRLHAEQHVAPSKHLIKRLSSVISEYVCSVIIPTYNFELAEPLDIIAFFLCFIKHLVRFLESNLVDLLTTMKIVDSPQSEAKERSHRESCRRHSYSLTQVPRAFPQA